MRLKSVKVRIKGKVQGVGFRYFIFTKAKELGFTGYVKNESDGSVLIFAQGESDQLDGFLNVIRNGSKVANIEKLEIVDSNPENMDDFTIII